MKQLTIVVKPFRAEAVLRAIADLDVIACVAQEAKGYSRQKGYLDRYVGSEYSMAFLPKVEISVWVSDDKAEEVANRIIKSAHRPYRRRKDFRREHGLARGFGVLAFSCSVAFLGTQDFEPAGKHFDL